MSRITFLNKVFRFTPEKITNFDLILKRGLCIGVQGGKGVVDGGSASYNSSATGTVG